jgi:hypothetical protein
MTSISTTLTHHRTRTSRSTSRWLWRDIAIGLTLPVIVAAAMTVQPNGNREAQLGYGSPAIQAPASAGGWENAVPPEMFPLGVLAPEVAR